MGVRAHFVHAARPGELNAFPCAVARVVDDVFTTIVLLHPRGAARDAPPLRMELDKAPRPVTLRMTWPGISLTPSVRPCCAARSMTPIFLRPSRRRALPGIWLPG